MGGSSQPKTTTQKVELPAFEEQALRHLYGAAKSNFENYRPEYFPDSTVAPMSQYTQQGVEAMAGMPGSDFSQNLMQQAQQLAAGGQAGTPDAFAAGQRGQDLFGVGTPGQNQVTDDLVNRVISANTENFNRDVMPRLQQQQVENNAYGGTRGALAEGQAAADLGARNLDAASQIYSNALSRDQELNMRAASMGAQMQGQDIQAQQAQDRITGSMLPVAQQIQRSNLQPLLAAGDVDNAYRQALVDDERARWEFNQQQPYLAQQLLANTVKGGTGAGTTTSTAPGPSTGGLVGALGGASTGAGIASTLGLSTPWGAGLAGIGALAGLF